MSREVHVRICEGVGVRFPHATRLFSPMSKEDRAFAFPLLHHYRAVLGWLLKLHNREVFGFCGFGMLRFLEKLLFYEICAIMRSTKQFG